MRCVDTNVLVYAYRADLPENPDYRRLIEQWANDDEPLGLPDLALSGFLRIMTNRRVFREPSAPAQVWEMIRALLNAPAAIAVKAGPRHWDLFQKLASDIDARGNDVPDAYLAAYALENNATFFSADRGFARFSRLRWRHPLES